MSDAKALPARVMKCLETVRTIRQEVKPGTMFKADLGFESIDVVDLLFELEQEFKRQFPMKQFNAFVLEKSPAKNWDFSFATLCEFTEKIAQSK